MDIRRTNEQHKSLAPMLRKAATSMEAPIVVVRFLLERCPQALEQKDDDGYLPVHIAAGRSATDVLRLFVDACPEALMGANCNGSLPMHVAAQRDAPMELELIRLLLERCPAALEVKDNREELPLHVASGSCSADVGLVRLLADGRPPGQKQRRTAPASRGGRGAGAGGGG